MLQAFILLFSAATILWLFYWAVVRQSIIDVVEDDLSRLRDSVSWHIINNSPDVRSKSAERLMQEIDGNGFLDWISFSQIAICTFRNRARIKAEAAREMELYETSPQWIRDARDYNSRLTLKAALANSPMWWFPLPAILLGAVFSKQLLDWWRDAGIMAIQMRSNHQGIAQPI